jgi:hypothetical protein
MEENAARTDERSAQFNGFPDNLIRGADTAGRYGAAGSAWPKAVSWSKIQCAMPLSSACRRQARPGILQRLGGRAANQHRRHRHHLHTRRDGQDRGVAIEHVVQDAVDAGTQRRGELDDRRRDAVNRTELNGTKFAAYHDG